MCAWSEDIQEIIKSSSFVFQVSLAFSTSLTDAAGRSAVSQVFDTSLQCMHICDILLDTGFMLKCHWELSSQACGFNQANLMKVPGANHFHMIPKNSIGTINKIFKSQKIFKNGNKSCFLYKTRSCTKHLYNIFTILPDNFTWFM